MTLLGKIVITAGIVIFTISSILWITESDWRYFAGGAAIFGGTLLTSIILSIETKQSSNGERTSYQHGTQWPANGEREWELPSTPAPDENTTNDPFLDPPRS